MTGIVKPEGPKTSVLNVERALMNSRTLRCAESLFIAPSTHNLSSLGKKAAMVRMEREVRGDIRDEDGSDIMMVRSTRLDDKNGVRRYAMSICATFTCGKKTEADTGMESNNRELSEITLS